MRLHYSIFFAAVVNATYVQTKKEYQHALAQTGAFVNAEGQAVDPSRDYGLVDLQLRRLKVDENMQFLALKSLTRCRDMGGSDCEQLVQEPPKEAPAFKETLRKTWQYMAEVKVGNPPQTLNAVLDTGSTDLFVSGTPLLEKILNKSKNMTDEQAKLSGFLKAEDLGNAFNPALSKTVKDRKLKGEAAFGAGPCKYSMYEDDIRLGGDKIHLKKLPLGVLYETNFLTGKKGELEAIVGMSYKGLAHYNMDGLPAAIRDQVAPKSSLFAFYQPSDVKKTPEVTFGYYDKTKMKGAVNWNPVISKNMYNIQLDDIKVNGKALHVCDNMPEKVQHCTLAIDSGLPMDVIPPWIGDIMAKNGNPTEKGVDCPNGIKDMGKLTFVIGGKDYSYEPDMWLKLDEDGINKQAQQHNHQFANVLGPALRAGADKHMFSVPVSSATQIPSFVKPKGQKCKSKLFFKDFGDSAIILGHQFMDKYYTIFDRENDRVGIATSIDNKDE